VAESGFRREAERPERALADALDAPVRRQGDEEQCAVGEQGVVTSGGLDGGLAQKDLGSARSTAPLD